MGRPSLIREAVFRGGNPAELLEDWKLREGGRGVTRLQPCIALQEGIWSGLTTLSQRASRTECGRAANVERVSRRTLACPDKMFLSACCR